jgi:hypothetical protein
MSRLDVASEIATARAWVEELGPVEVRGVKWQWLGFSGTVLGEGETPEAARAMAVEGALKAWEEEREGTALEWVRNVVEGGSLACAVDG